MDSAKFDNIIRSIARSMAVDDEYLFEELRSEMHLAILDIAAGKQDAYYIVSAKNKAIDYFRARGRRMAIETISLEQIRASGIQIDTNGNIYFPPKKK